MTIYLLLAALGGFFWALVIILDRLALLNIFKHPLQALVITGLLGSWGFGIIPFVDSGLPSVQAGILAFIGGVILWLSYGLYFTAMNITDEASEVAAWDAAHPLLVAMLALPLGLALSATNWIGIVVICGSIVAFQWHKGPPLKLTIPTWAYRTILFGNAAGMAGSYLLMSLAIQQSNYWDVYPLYLAGTCSAIVIIFWPPVFRAFKETWKQLLPWWWLFALMEMCNVIAPLLITMAMQRAHPAVATALGATFPIYIALAGPILRFFGASEDAFPKIERPWIRALILVCLVIGIALLYSSNTAFSW